MIHKEISIMILSLIDILFFDDVHAGDHVDEKSLEQDVQCWSVVKTWRWQSWTWTWSRLFSDDGHVGVQGDEKQCDSVEQGFSFDDDSIVVLMMNKVLTLKTTTVVFVMTPSKVKTPNTNENIN